MLEIAKFSGAQVVGLNPCEYQLKRVKHHIEQDKMQDYCSFVKVSYRLNRLSSFYVYIIKQKKVHLFRTQHHAVPPPPPRTDNFKRGGVPLVPTLEL